MGSSPCAALRTVAFATLAAALASLLGASCRGPEPAPVSVLLVTLDTTRPDHLGSHGYGRPTSPRLDALAAAGVRFERAWSHAPETAPSLATVLTSRRAAVTGVRGNVERLDASLPTLATAAKSAGLRTAAFVSTVLLRRDACAFERGFDVYDDTMTDPCFGHDAAQRIAPRTTDAAVAWLRSSQEPFLCWVHLYDPHGPYTPPEPTPELDATRGMLPSTSLSPALVPAYQRVGGAFDSGDYLDRYDREILVADRHVGRLLDAVDLARTLVVVHADHGESLGEDEYWFRHGSLLHDAALRVPWILAGAGVPARRTVAGDVRLLDLAPTALSLAGLPPLAGAEGRDLAEVVRGRAAPPPLHLVAEARRSENVRDAQGIDVRWKVRVKTAERDETLHPADPASRESPSWRDAEAWLSGPERPSSPPQEPGELDPLLRGLGYR